MRIRITKVDEFQLLTCLQHGLWGSNSARFKDWQIGAYSEAKRTVIPREGGQPFRRKADTDSDGTRTVIPTECGHPSRDVRGFFWS